MIDYNDIDEEIWDPAHNEPRDVLEKKTNTELRINIQRLLRLKIMNQLDPITNCLYDEIWSYYCEKEKDK